MEQKMQFHSADAETTKSDKFGEYSDFFKDDDPSILLFINDYHCHCLLCDHHFYSISKVDDINSFFQPHLNSADHAWNKKTSKLSDKDEIFKWEKWLYSGFCNICSKSDVEAFIINIGDIIKIVKNHITGPNHCNNKELVQSNVWQRTVPTLYVVADMCICRIDDTTYFCQLCSVVIHSIGLIDFHLKSYRHAKIFCSYIKNKYTTIPDEKLCTETIMNLIALKPLNFPFKCSASNIDKYEIEIENPDDDYSTLSYKEMGFSPQRITNLLFSDNISKPGTICLLCDEEPRNMTEHLNSNSHNLRKLIFEKCSLLGDLRPKIVNINNYHQMSFDDCRGVLLYMRYKRLLQKHKLDFGIPYKPKFKDFTEFDEVILCDKELREEISTAIKTESNMKTDIGNSQSKIITRTDEVCASKNTKKNTINAKADIKALADKKSVSKNKSASPKKEVVKDDNTASADKKRKSEMNKSPKKEVTARKPNEKHKSVPENAPMKNSAVTSVKSSNIIDEKEINFKEEVEAEVKCIVKGMWPVSEDMIFCKDCVKKVHESRIIDHVESKEHVSNLKQNARIVNMLLDKDYISVIKCWIISKNPYLVCTVCCISMEKCAVLDHLTTQSHIKKYDMFKSGKKRYSILDCVAHPEKKILTCKFCGVFLCLISEIKSHFTRVIKSIRKHKCKNFETLLVTGERTEKDINVVSSESEDSEDETNSINEYDKDLIELKPEGNTKHGMAERKQKDNKNSNKKEGMRLSGTKKRLANQERLHHVNTTKQLNASIAELFPSRRSVAEAFLCMVCLETDGPDALKRHIQTDCHLKNQAYIANKKLIRFEYCNDCNLFLLGTNFMMKQHLNSTYHKLKLPEKQNKKDTKVFDSYLLIIKGKNLINSCKKQLVAFLEGYGKIRELRVKEFTAEVTFYDPSVVTTIVNLEKVTLDEDCVLKFFLRTVGGKKPIIHITRLIDSSVDDHIFMKSELIAQLGNLSILKKFIQHLVRSAVKMEFSVEEREKEATICASLTKNISVFYPNCKCHIFGSRRTGLSVDKTDLDVFVDCGNMYDGAFKQDQIQQAEIVVNVAQILRFLQEFKNVIGIERSRVPIVTCSHAPTNINCDLSFKNGLSCENTKLISFMLSLDERVKNIILFLKAWLQMNDLYGRPKFSSYALIMLIFYYLAQEPNPVLPTIDFLKKKYRGPPRVIADWDCGFTTDKSDVTETTNSKSVEDLISGFFKFYSEFDFKTYIVSPLMGQPLNREFFTKNGVSEIIMEPYKKHISKICPDSYTLRRNPICIMDPFDMSHNLTKAFPAESLNAFVYLCRISANLLSNAINYKPFDHLY